MPFLNQWTQERFIYLKRKLYIVVNECSFELGSISFMRAGVIKIVRLDLYGTPCAASKYIGSVKTESNLADAGGSYLKLNQAD